MIEKIRERLQKMTEKEEMEETREEISLTPEEERMLEAADDEEGVIIHDADAEDALEEARRSRAGAEASENAKPAEDIEEPHNVRSMAEMMA
ncbi:MAG: hypothetical protein M3362_17840, partial [Acidobacteriota bacterium]|nr:hypothetical protein [Acidobacteriota bacterium]